MLTQTRLDIYRNVVFPKSMGNGGRCSGRTMEAALVVGGGQGTYRESTLTVNCSKGELQKYNLQRLDMEGNV